MFTYIVYHGSEGDGFEEASEMFRSAAEQGILRCREVPAMRGKLPFDLSRDIEGFCWDHGYAGWQLMFVENNISAYKDVGQIYHMYCEIAEYMERYVLPRVKRRPENIYVMVSADADIQGCIQGVDFFERVPGDYRFLLYRGGKSLAGYDVWRVCCNVLILTGNQNVRAAMEYGGIYALEWNVNRNLAGIFLAKAKDALRQIKERLNYYPQTVSHHKSNVLPEFPNRIVYLGRSKKTVPIKKKAFPCFNNAGNVETEKWRLENDTALKEMRKLCELPLGRWEREIEESRKDEIPEIPVGAAWAQGLTKEAEAELQRRKEGLAESIYDIELHDEKIRSILRESIRIEKELEYSIKTRMSRLVCARTMAGWICAVFMFFVSWLYAHADFDSGESETVLCVGLLSLAVYIVVQIVLGLERTGLRRKINKKLKQVDKLLESDDKDYQLLLQKVLLHKRYCYYEAWLKRERKDSGELVQNLKNHNHAADRAARYIAFLARILDISQFPAWEKTEEIAIDYDLEPQLCRYYYFPYRNFWNTDTLQNRGDEVQTPYPFIEKCSLRKVPIIFK